MVIRLNENYEATLNTALLGYVGETNARPVSFEGLTVDGADRYVLTIDYGDGVEYEVDITDGTWTPTADILRSAQTVSCQIAAKKLSGQEYILVKKSRIFRLRIGAAIGDTAIPSPDVAVDALDRIDAIGRQAHADMQTAQTAAETATTAANNAGKSADTATQAAERAETAQTAAEKSATQAENAKQGAETARTEAVTAQNNAKISADQAASAAKQTTADKTATAGYAKTAKTNADSATADRQAVTDMAAQVTADKTTVAENTAKVAEDRTAAETAAQTAQAVADSLPDDYVTAVEKIAENTAEISAVKLTDKELQRRVNALYDMGNGITHRFETDSDTAYAKAVPTGAKLMSVKNVGGRSLVWNQLVNISERKETTGNGVTFTFSKDGTITLNGTATKTGSPIALAITKNVKGHKYLIIANLLSGVYGENQLLFTSQSYGADTTGHGAIITNESSNAEWYYVLLLYAGVTYDNVKLQPQLFDITAMFGSGNEPTSVEEFEKMFPAEYYPYNAGEIVNAGTESVVEQGRNLYYGTDMLKVGSDDYEYIANSYRCKAVKLKPNTTYTLSFTSDKTSEIILLMNVNANVNSQPYLDFRKTSDTRSYRTGDNGCLYVGVYAGYGSVTSADVVKRLSECEIMISEGDTPTAFTPYHRNEYPIPEAVKSLPGYGWSAGTARNYIDYENKRYVQSVGSVDLGTLTWTKGESVSFKTHHLAGQKLTKGYDSAPNFMCPRYSTKTQNESWGKKDVTGIAATSNVGGYIYVNDTSYTDATTFKQAMQGVILYYELATPIVTDISTLIDDDFLRNIEVEAGGSITFKGSNDSYRIPVPSEEEYVVKLSEVGGSV